MKINKNILSIPPYISTSWEHVVSLQQHNGILIVYLGNGKVEIPNLQPSVIEAIFLCHAHFLESHQEKKELKSNSSLIEKFENNEIPFKLGFGTFDTLGSALQHNPAHANAPDLPKEMLNKISAIAKIVAPDHQIEIPKAEPQCNCIHCQIARAISEGVADHRKEDLHPEEEVVSADDLKFQQWDIEQSGDKLYTVTNKLDVNEKYNVYLGHPVGCTCGMEGCEHILAVLKS